MSESEVSQIRDEDVLRRMWQQTEDFGRKKEIRAHMYKLREERLRDLYSPEPALQGKGSEFSAAPQGHGQSFADQTFQSMKSKEVRDASSPPKEYSYRRPDLKELSNAGWNVESEDRRTDDGRTHVKSVNANIEGRYDVEGGQGQFAAVDKQRRAVTEHHDANSSLHRDETSSNTAAHEHVERQTADGARVSSTTSSSNTSTKIQQVSSTTHEVPFEDDYDLRRTHDTNRNERIIKTTNNDYEQSLRSDSSALRKNDSSTAELVSRKVEYPDDNTRVIVETRVLPDGTRVTSTRREFRVPAQTSRSETRSSQSRSYSTQHTSDHRDSASTTRHTIDRRSNDIVDSQRNVDDHDFKRQLHEYTSNDNDDYSTQQQHISKINKKVTDHTQTNDDVSQKRYETRVVNSKVVVDNQTSSEKNDRTYQRHTVNVDQSTTNRDDTRTQRQIVDRRNDYRSEDTDRHHTITTRDDAEHKVIKETRHVSDFEKRHTVNVDQSTTNRDDQTRTQRQIVDRRNDYRSDDTDRHHNTTTRDDAEHKVIKETRHVSDFEKRHTVNVDQSTTNKDDQTRTQHQIVDRQNNYQIDDTDRHHRTTTRDDVAHKVIKETRHVSDSEKMVHNISRERQDNEEIIRHYPRDRMVPDEENRDISRDRIIPVDKVHGIPKGSIPPTEKTRDIPRDKSVPVNEARDVPRNETFPKDNLYDAPRDDSSPKDRPRGTPKDTTTTTEKVRYIKKDTTADDVIERKTSTEHYQTTYQNDFQSRKVSTDWSPTHQAWASTLRSDTPSTTRPSTRASSSGSKTFKSSTSSLRSSVSPDKSNRKPSSRGGSPSKVDRSSPTRTVTSDRYSSTHSTHTVTEEKINKNRSPERKPPTGRSPTGPGYSPDRKPQDSYRQRPSVSPDKKPQDSYRQRPSVSPDKKPKSFSDRPHVSPDRKYTGEHPRTTSPLGKKEAPKSPMRSKESPERKPAYQPSDGSPSDTHPRTSPQRATSSPDRKPADRIDQYSPRASTSPDRQPGNQKPTNYPASSHPRNISPSRPYHPTDDSPRKSGTSPDRKPSSQQPTTQLKSKPDKPSDNSPKESPTNRPSASPDRKPGYMRPTASSQPDDKEKTPSKIGNDDRKSPNKQVPSQSPDKKTDDLNKTSKIKEDHYRFVDEETKVYNRTDKINVDNKTTTDYSRPRDNSSSPTEYFPGEDSPDYCKPREPVLKKDNAPIKDTVITSINDDLYGRVENTDEEITITSQYDKKTDENTITKRIHKNKENPEENDSPSREMSPSKYGTYDKKKPREELDTTVVTTITSDVPKDVKHDTLTRRDKTSPKKVSNVPTSPVKKTPRDSVSPSKSPTKDTKYKYTTDFIATERTTEEVNKKTPAKDRPRQLVTPSSSPTRKPKTTETEPSTGQSSPTTSVSGFVYFGSPRSEKPVTDLDEFFPDSETPDGTTKRPESLDVKRSPSPSKIPCRSPSPEKHVPTTKDSLPRKSSLKKPSKDSNQTSPIEKPPTSFSVSPTDDKSNVIEHKIIKKDRPSEPEAGEPEIAEPKFSEKPKPPLQRRETYDDRCKKILGLVDDTTETVTKETRKYTRKPDSNQNSPSVSPCDSPSFNESTPFSNYPATKNTTNIVVTDFIDNERENISKITTTRDQPKNKTPSRDSSPTKLQDITSKTTPVTKKTTKDEVEEDTVTKIVTTKYPSPKQSIEPRDSPKDFTKNQPDDIPERTAKPSRPTETLPTRSDVSPERKLKDKSPKDISPTRTKPERSPGYTNNTVTPVTNSTYDASSFLEDVQETTRNVKTSQPTRVLEFPIRETPRSTTFSPEQPGRPRTTSPSKQQPKDGSPIRKARESPEKEPGYVKSTTTITSKLDSYDTTEDVDEIRITTNREQKIVKTKVPSPAHDTPRDKSPSKSTPSSDSTPKRHDTSPQRKPVSATKEPDSTQEVPGYMRTTKNTTIKLDKTIVSEDVQETTKSTKTTVNKKVISSGSVSPTRRPTQPKLPSERTPSPTKPTRPSEISIGKNPDKSQPSSPVKESPSTKIEPNDTKSSSPTRASPQSVPSYMKPTESMTLKHEHEVSKYDVTDTDIQETITSTVTEKKHPKSSVSPTRHPSKSTDKTSPEYPRTTSPARSPSNDSPKRRDSPEPKPSRISKESPSTKIEPKDTKSSSPTRASPQSVPSYMKPTESMTLKHEHEVSKYDVTDTDIQETITSTVTEKKHPKSSVSPTRHPSKSTDKTSPEYPRTLSPARSPSKDSSKRRDSPESKPSRVTKESPAEKYQHPKSTSPTRTVTIGHKVTTDTSKVETTLTTKDINDHTKHNYKNIPGEGPVGSSPRSLSPSKPTEKTPRTSALSPDRKSGQKSPVNYPFPENRPSKDAPKKLQSSPETPSYMKPTASIISKLDSTVSTYDSEETYKTKIGEPKSPSPRKSTTPGQQSPEREFKETPGYLLKPREKDEEPRQLRTPSPTKKTTTINETNTDFIMSEREQEILNKVQKSLRKLSPERKEKSPSRERSPTKTTTSLQDLDIITSETIETQELTDKKLTEVVEEELAMTSKVPRPTQLKDDKPKDQKVPSKPSSRNVSPIKRAPTTPTSNRGDKMPESPTKARSFSPKKPVSHVDRPESPQQPKTSGIRPREHIPHHLTRKPTPATLSTTRIERLTTEVKKTNGVTKQNVSTKTSSSKTTTRSIPSPTGKINEPDTKRTPSYKKDNVSPKKDAVIRTASDTTLKPKKTSSPQRMKSKPEIQVSDMSTKSPKSQKHTIKEPHSKLPNKPKSATSLNTSIDEDDIIIDVQQSKSSRENSPDRICPTPINFADDVGVPRFPDEVSEPDDELVKRSHHTIHETESVVDDIVEICEDEELFVKKSDREVITEEDESLLSVNDKVNKFTSKIYSTKKPKDTTINFKDTERRVHSDFIDENLKSDECLLTVSEKVNKFAKGPKDKKDSRSPSRKITDEYDRDTVYTDDYTKLSVNDKAHLFVETAENIKTTKVKPAQKVERPDLSQVDEYLKSDDCLLSVSDKVNKFVKTAEQYFTETQEIEEKESKVKHHHEKVTKEIIDDEVDETYRTKEILHTQETKTSDKLFDYPRDSSKPRTKESEPSQPKVRDYGSPNAKPVDKIPAVKITTLRSSEAVKKAKALFENIASTQKTTQKDTTLTTKTTKLTDIGVIKKTPKTDSTTVLHPSVENVSPEVTDVESEVDSVPHTDRPSSGTLTKPQHSHVDEKPRRSPNRLTAQSPEAPRTKSPMRQNVEVTTTKTVLSRYPAAARAESPRHRPESPKPRTESPRHRPESPKPRTETQRQRTESPRQRPDSDKPDKVPGYLRPTKTSQIKEETKIEEAEVSNRRGSGKFGVELRRTSVERSTVSSERRRSVEHHQPCIEDIYDLDLLEQMLEKVVGYEQRRRIRAQIRVAKNHSEHVVETNTYSRTSKQTTTVPKSRSPDRKAKSPERAPKSTPQRTTSPERHNKSTPQRTVPDRTHSKEPTMNGHAKEPIRTSATRQRPHSPEKPAPKSTLAPKTPVRQPSPDKRRTTSPSKTVPKPKGNRFNEYASAYMKKVGLNESDKVKFSDTKTKKTTESRQTVKHERQQQTVQEFSTTKSFTERTSSKDVIEYVQTNGKRSLSPDQRQSPERKVQFPDSKTQVPDRKAISPERRAYSPEQKTRSPERKAQSPDRKAQSPDRKAQSPDRKAQSPDRKAYSPERKAQSPERLHQRTPSPDFKRPKAETVKETIIKTVYDIEKKIPSKPVQEVKPSWITNRNLKKITSESRTFSSKKIDNEKPKYRAPSPSKVIAKPIDVITSSYGPGPLDADGKPLFGIKALRNGGSNFQVKGTVIRQEFHSRNGGEPEGTVSVTAYSSQPEELEQLLASQGAEPPSRIHGLAAITTTKKFGGDTGNTLSNVHTREDRASLEQFTHHDRRVEHLEHDSRTHEFSGDTTIEEITTSRGNTRIEDITGSTRRTDTKKERQDRTDRRKEEKVTDIKRQKVEERREKMERREDKKTVRQSSVKSLTEKYIKSANDSGKERSAYPKAGLILRTTSMRDSVSSDDAQPAGIVRTDSEHSLCSVDDTVVTTTTEQTGDGVRTTTTRSTHHHHHHPTATTHRSTVVTQHEPVITTKKTIICHEPVITTRKTMVVGQEPVITKRTTVVTQEPVTRVTQTRQGTTTSTERSFLDSNTKVTGVQDILTRMKNADIVIQEGDTTEDSEARALLNKFLGATVLMAGMQGYVADQPDGKLTVHQETVRSGSGGKVSSRSVQDLDLDQCWDERLLKKLLEECTDYEQRRRLRARIRTLMAEQEACASAVTEALGACGAGEDEGGAAETREEEEVTVTSSVRRDSSDKTVSSSTTTKTSKVIEMTRSAPKPVSPFAKFRQLEKQNSTSSPNSPKSPQSPGSPSQPYFKFTDPALQSSALTIKERLLQWCRDKTRDYENVKLENFSTSWADGLAFCALIHHFLPTTFDYSKLTPDRRRHNFTLAFKVADEKAGIYPLLDVDDMVAMRKPDWKCVFTYVQAIYRRFKDEP